MKSILLSVTLVILLSGNWAVAQEAQPTRVEKIKSLQQRLNELEKSQSEIDKFYKDIFEQSLNRTKPRLDHRISLGGYFETGLINIYGSNTDNQLVAHTHAIGINIGAEFSEKIRFVGQTLSVVEAPLLNPNNNPKVNPSSRKFSGISVGSIVGQGYVEYSANDFFNIQSGIGYVPFGIAYQQREPFLFHPRGGPQFINNDDGFNIHVVSPFWQGLHIYGLFPLTNDNSGYDIYTVSPGTKLGSLGLGGRLWWTMNDAATLGTSVQYGERTDGHYLSSGFDVDIKYKQFGLIAECSNLMNTGDVVDGSSYYIEPYYKFLDDKWLIYITYEYLNAPNRIDLASGISDPFETRYYGFGVNWLPISNTRVRLGYLKHDYIDEPDEIILDRDFDAIELSAAIAF